MAYDLSSLGSASSFSTALPDFNYDQPAATSSPAMPTLADMQAQMAAFNQASNAQLASVQAMANNAQASRGTYSQIPSDYTSTSSAPAYSAPARVPGGAGTNPNLSPAPAVRTLPGGAGITANGEVVSNWGPNGETENQAQLQAQLRNTPNLDLSHGAGQPGGNAAMVANALVSASKGAGVGVGGWNPGPDVVKGWLADPDVQKAMPFGYDLSSLGYSA